MVQSSIQATAIDFFNDRSEKAFNIFYNKLRGMVLQVSKKILKDQEYAEENVSKVFVKIHKNKDTFVFDPSKSFLSWLYNTTKNEAIMKYKSLKRNQEYVESTFINEGNEEIENMLAFLAYNNADNSVIDVLEETSIEDEIAFHDDKVALNKRIYDLLGTVCASEEDAEIMRDGFFRGIGTLELKELYGFDSRITVTTRKRRSLQKVKKHLDLEINYSKFNSKELVEGEVIKRGDNGEIEMKLFVKHSKIEGEAQFFKDGKLISSYFYVNGKREGLYKKYKDGVLEVEGMYSNNEKTGYWKRFHENGKLAEIREWSTGIYVIYDEEGKLEGQGTIKKTTEIEEVNSTYPCGSPKMRGIKHQGKRVGVWTKFYQSGAVEEIANYFDKNAVCFTEKGELEEEFAIL